MAQAGVADMASGAETSRGLNIVLWVLQIAAALLFLLAGGSKLAGVQPAVESFGKLGLGQWFRYFTGLMEVSGAILILIPSRAAIGAVMLLCVMVGAVFTHLFIIGGNPAPAIVLLAIMATVTWVRRGTLPMVG